MALPNTASTQQIFSTCVAQGGKDWDHSAMVRAIELTAGFSLDSNAKAD
jgi:2-hydroxy-3-oxopropionate reductase